jgi:hypothetical protein
MTEAKSKGDVKAVEVKETKACPDAVGSCSLCPDVRYSISLGCQFPLAVQASFMRARAATTSTYVGCAMSVFL